MFGLEDKEKKGKKAVDETFELEFTLEEPSQRNALKKKVEEKIQNLKNALRTGGSKEEMDQLGVVLHGFASLQKMIKQAESK